MAAITNKLNNLRAIINRLKIAAFIVPTKDAHNSEYICSRDKRREFVSGFSGSAGTAIVAAEKAALWVDGRYWIAAEDQTDPAHWSIVRMGDKDQPTLAEWLKRELPAESTVGVDPFLTSASEYKKWEDEFAPLVLKPLECNPVDEIWEKPEVPIVKIKLHHTRYCGELTEKKFDRLRAFLTTKNCSAVALTALDEIAWLLNLRGGDIDYNPVFIAYLVLGEDFVDFFVDSKKIESEVAGYLSELNVTVRPYEEMMVYCAELNKKLCVDKKKILLTPSQCNYAVYRAFDPKVVVEEKTSPVEKFKAIKNETELEGMRQAHIRDGAAKTAWLAWLEETVSKGEEKLTEISAAAELEKYRRAQPDFVSLSFDSISAVGANGAIIHYKPTEESDTPIDKCKLYLIDSGAQYRDGTTDVTRTLHFSTPTAEQKRFFTLVLKGHIALARAVFPSDVSGSAVDAFARQFLWSAGADYRHGTGHGVGSALNVHEGPQFISVTRGEPSPGLEAGMVVSNEPGYYKKGDFGIRIENVMLILPSEPAERAESDKGQKFLRCETVTMVPLQRKLIDLALMTAEEVAWVNEYHGAVEKSLRPLLESDARAVEYLERECGPIFVD